MKKIFVFVSLLLFGNIIFAQYDSIFVDGNWRTFLTHVPTHNIENISSLPLVLCLHGGFGNAYNIETSTQFSIKADTTKQPFVVVYPEGINSPLGIRTWNAGYCCGYSTNNNINDVKFISELIDTIENSYKIDTKRVYVTGLSNGGMMSFRLAAELTSKISAIAPVAASMTFNKPWNPSRPIPIIQFHSFLDDNIPYFGGIGEGVSNHYNPPIDSVLNQWSILNNCSIENDTMYNEQKKYLFKTWTNCKNNSDIYNYITYDGGHSWPGSENGSKVVNATNLIWDFFIDHPTDSNLTELTAAPILKNSFELKQNYPNPFNPSTKISYTLNKTGFVTLSIYNILGSEIAILVNKKQSAGSYFVNYDAKELTSGIYFYQITVDSEIGNLKKMMFLK